MLKRVQANVKRGVHVVSTAISGVTKPVVHGPALGAVADLVRSKPQPVTENILLRQQLIVLNRSASRPRFTPADRRRFVLLASRVQTWKAAGLCQNSMHEEGER